MAVRFSTARTALALGALGGLSIVVWYISEIGRYVFKPYLIAKELLDIFEFAAVALTYECDGFAVIVGSGGSSDAVHIVFGLARNIIIDYHRYVIDVDAAGHDIGRHKNVYAAGAETVHDLLALGLIEVAVHLAGFPSVLAQLSRQLFDLELRRCEHDDTLRVCRLEQVLENRCFLRLVTYDLRLVNLLRRLRYGYLDFDGIDKNVLGQLLDLGRHSGREHQCLALPGQLHRNLENVVIKAHIEHAVSLVENEYADFRQIDIAHLHVSQQAPGGSDDDISTHLQALLLPGEILAVGTSVDSHAAYRQKI